MHPRVYVVMNEGVWVMIFVVVDVGAEQVVLKLILLLGCRMARVIVLIVGGGLLSRRIPMLHKLV